MRAIPNGPGYGPGPQPGYAPQVRRNDGYIYPADGSSTDQIYPAPRPRAQVYPPQQQYYYQDRGYAPAPQGNYYQPRQYYQQQRGGYYIYQD